MRYKRRINYVDAVRWTGQNKEEIEKFGNCTLSNDDLGEEFREDYILITTPNGRVMANKGDWICKDICGKLYPCSDEVFRHTYYTEFKIPIEPCCKDMADAVMMNEFREGIAYFDDEEMDQFYILWSDNDMIPLRFCPACGKPIRIIGQKVSDNDLKEAIQRLYDNITKSESE